MGPWFVVNPAAYRVLVSSWYQSTALSIHPYSAWSRQTIMHYSSLCIFSCSVLATCSAWEIYNEEWMHHRLPRSSPIWMYRERRCDHHFYFIWLLSLSYFLFLPCRYPKLSRVDWLMGKSTDTPSGKGSGSIDPCQIMLLVAQIGFVYKVEKALSAQGNSFFFLFFYSLPHKTR